MNPICVWRVLWLGDLAVRLASSQLLILDSKAALHCRAHFICCFPLRSSSTQMSELPLIILAVIKKKKVKTSEGAPP